MPTHAHMTHTQISTDKNTKNHIFLGVRIFVFRRFLLTGLSLLSAIALLFVFITVTSCTRKEEKPLNIIISQTPLFEDYSNYLVIKEFYIRIYDKLDTKGTVIGIGRAGDIFTILESAGQEPLMGYYWYKVYREDDDLTGWILTYDPLLLFTKDYAIWYSKKYKELASTKSNLTSSNVE